MARMLLYAPREDYLFRSTVMKMRFTFPILILALAVAACGKKDAPVNTTVAPIAVQPLPVNPYPNPNPNPNPNDLASFCQYSGGQISGSVCQIERNYQNQAWFSISIGDFNTNVPVYTGERVSVSMSGSARVYVGGYQYGTGSTSFLATTSGYVTLQKYTSTYNIQQIRVRTCYSAPNQRSYCP